ncbi:MAG: hypothetical protein IKM46_07665 [Clostridia bacterium]|nr:hypothetical protein [Clostridia bacterium]
MKRIIAFLLAMLMCFSMTACSEDEGDGSGKKKNKDSEETEETETFVTKEEFVGKWYMSRFTWSADGRLDTVEAHLLELKDDGSAELTVISCGESGTASPVYNTTQIDSWEYSKRHDVILIELDGKDHGYDVCRSDDGSDASLGYGYIPDDEENGYFNGFELFEYVYDETYYRLNENCDVCQALPAGKYMSEYSELTVNEDGSLTYNGETYDMHGTPCYGPSHLRFIDSLTHFCYIPEENTVVFCYGSFTKLDGEYIAFTADNWRDYFSENFYDTFETVYKVNYGKDTWGDYQASVETDVRLKDIEKYGDYTNMTVEYNYAYFVPVVMKYNTQTSKIVSVNVNYTSGDDNDTPETSAVRVGDVENSGFLELMHNYSNATITETNGDIITLEFDMYSYPTSINRMQGTLVIK